MIRLVRVELTRLRWRRAVVALVVIAIAVPLVVLALRAYNTRPFSDADRAEAEQLAEEQREYMEQDIQRCLRNPSDFGIDTENADRRCEQVLSYPINPEDFLYRPQLRIAEERRTSGLAVVAVLAVAMLLAGTTFVGHDWNTGSMGNQLLFESRRGRVWTAKAIAIGLLALVVGGLGLTLFWSGMFGVASTRDLDPSGQVLTDVTQHAGRGLVVIVGAALGGYALTTLVRSTVFTIGVLFAVSVAGGLLFGALLPDSAQRFEPATNAVALVNGQVTYYVYDGACGSASTSPYDPASDCDPQRRLTQRDGALYYGVLLLAIGAVSAASYRRRDVP